MLTRFERNKLPDSLFFRVVPSLQEGEGWADHARDGLLRQDDLMLLMRLMWFFVRRTGPLINLDAAPVPALLDMPGQ
jgi:hypothetical protein